MTLGAPLRVFDRYELLRPLAVGGMGEIFLARQVGLAGFDRLVVLKSLRPELAADPSFVDQFLDEARLMALLNHPNVASVLEVGQWRGVYFLAMEHIEGVALSDLMTQASRHRRPLQPETIATLMRDAALGLHHAHALHDGEGRPLQMIHRDVSPQNLMVRHDLVTKVVDFGIAKAAGSVSRTTHGQIKGKLRYLAPELVDGEAADAATDQFSLGIVFWELCAWQPLFKGRNPIQLFTEVQQPVRQRPSDLRPDIPTDLEDIAMRMLTRDRTGRHPSLQHVADALDAWLARHTAERQSADDDVRVLLRQMTASARNLTPAPCSVQGLLVDVPTCPGCAGDLSEHARFCPTCGFALQPQTAPAARVPDVAQAFADVPITDADTTQPIDVAGLQSASQPSSPTGWTAASLKSLMGRARHLHLTGRDVEMEQVRALLCGGPGPRGLVVQGTPGSGKTAFLAEVSRECGRQQLQVIHVRGRDAGAFAHLDVVQQLVLTLLGNIQQKYSWDLDPILLLDAADLSPSDRQRCRRLLRGLPCEAPPSVVDDCAALARALLSTSHSDQLCVLVDDWDAVDPLSERVLTSMATQPSRCNLVVVGAGNATGAAPQLPVLTLPPLGEDALLRVAGLALAPDGSATAPPQAVRWATPLCHGNPGHLEHLMLLLRADGAIVDVDDRWMATEHLAHAQGRGDFAAVLQRRFSRLSKNARQFLRWGALVGRSFDAKLVAQAQELGIGWRALLGECEDNWIIERDDGPGEMYMFCSSSMREVLVKDISVDERSLVYRGLARVMRSRHPEPEDPRVVECLARYLAEGRPPKFDAIAPSVIALMERSQNKPAAAAFAGLQLDHALPQLAKRQQSSTLALRDVLEFFDQVQHYADQHAVVEPLKAINRLTHVLQQVPPQLLPLRRAGIERALARLYLSTGHLDRAERVFDLALERVGEADAAATAHLLADLTVLLYKRGDLGGCLLQIDECLRRGRHPDVVADATWAERQAALLQLQAACQTSAAASAPNAVPAA